MSTPIGPNVRRLIARKMSLLAIPAGSGKSSIALGFAALTDPKRMSSMAAEATNWVQAAIQAIKTAPDNTYGDDDEAIASVILAKLSERDAETLQQLTKSQH